MNQFEAFDFGSDDGQIDWDRVQLDLRDSCERPEYINNHATFMTSYQTYQFLRVQFKKKIGCIKYTKGQISLEFKKTNLSVITVNGCKAEIVKISN